MEVSMNWWKMISVFLKSCFDYDFGPIEKDLGINCFSQISNYKAIHKKGSDVQQKCQAKKSAL